MKWISALFCSAYDVLVLIENAHCKYPTGENFRFLTSWCYLDWKNKETALFFSFLFHLLFNIFYQEFQKSSWRFLSFLIYNTIFGKINVKLVPSAYLMHIVFQIRSIFWYFFCFVFFLQAGDWKITLIYYNTITSSPNFRGNPRCLQNHNCFMCSYVLLTQIAVIKTYERTSRTPLLQTPPGK